MIYILYIQAVYFIVTGVWPLVSITTFEKVTGPKTDKWLVQTFGMLITAVGISLAAGAYQVPTSNSTLVLAIASAAAVAAADLFFSLRGIISKVYLVDAAIELIFICFYIVLAIPTWD